MAPVRFWSPFQKNFPDDVPKMNQIKKKPRVWDRGNSCEFSARNHLLTRVSNTSLFESSIGFMASSDKHMVKSDWKVSRKPRHMGEEFHYP
jgi:hypothetical protein